LGEKELKELTIAVPAFNSEKFLNICLDSLLGVDDRLEVIIVNDGSTDDTLNVANDYAKKYPTSVVVLDKENGGHGSGINACLEIAKGRFFKVIDSDDWIDTENLVPILNALEKSNADAIVTGYKSVNASSKNIIEYPVYIPEDKNTEESKTFGYEVSMEEFVNIFDKMATSYAFHGLSYRTDFLRGIGLKMSEKVFFEDQEYAILPFVHVNTVLILPYLLYNYQIGNASQSVDYGNQAKHANDLKQVYTKIMDYYHFAKVDEEYRKAFFVKRLAILLASYYAVVLVKSKDKPNGRKEAAAVRAYVMQLEPEIQQYAEKRYRLMRLASSIRSSDKVYYKLFDSKKYKKFKRAWNK